MKVLRRKKQLGVIISRNQAQVNCFLLLHTNPILPPPSPPFLPPPPPSTKYRTYKRFYEI